MVRRELRKDRDIEISWKTKNNDSMDNFIIYYFHNAITIDDRSYFNTHRSQHNEKVFHLHSRLKPPFLIPSSFSFSDINSKSLEQWQKTKLMENFQIIKFLVSLWLACRLFPSMHRIRRVFVVFYAHLICLPSNSQFSTLSQSHFITYIEKWQCIAPQKNRLLSTTIPSTTTQHHLISQHINLTIYCFEILSCLPKTIILDSQPLSIVFVLIVY